MELYSIIKNEGEPGLLFWKHDKEDFRTGSQLIVAENEDALFCADGVIQAVFTAGKYSLRTENYPIIDRFRAKFSGGKGAFSCKIYFVNKADALELKWGTDSPIQVRDPMWGIATQIVARGSYVVRVIDSKKFVLKFVGNNFNSITPYAIRLRFRSATMQKIKSAITSAVRESNEEVLGLSAHLDEFSAKIRPAVAAEMEEYGIELAKFYVAAVDVPGDAPGREKLEEAMAQRAQLRILGDDWQRVQARDIMAATAANAGTPGVGAGIGLGLSAMSNIGAISAKTMAMVGMDNAGQSSSASIECSSCHQMVVAGSKFCSKCGTKLEQKQFCTSCGNPVSVGALFCGKCGAKLGGAS